MFAVADFHAADLAAAVEALDVAQIDQLPYGVIGLDPAGIVRVYNRTEAQRVVLVELSEQKYRGHAFVTDIAPCMDNEYFKGRIDAARAAGTLDIEFTFIGDFADRERELSVRVQSAGDGGVWIFHKRA